MRVEWESKTPPNHRWATSPRPSWAAPQIEEIHFRQDIAQAVIRQVIARYGDLESGKPMLRAIAEELLERTGDQSKAA